MEQTKKYIIESIPKLENIEDKLKIFDKIKEIDKKIIYFTNLKISNKNRPDIVTNNNNDQSINYKGINENMNVSIKHKMNDNNKKSENIKICFLKRIQIL